MPRLRIPTSAYSKARIIAGRDGLDFRAWAKAKATKYNGEPVSCVCTRADSVVVQVDVDLPADVIRSAIVAATQGVTLTGGEWSESTINSVIRIENFWERECSREQAIEILNKRLQERVSSLSRGCGAEDCPYCHGENFAGGRYRTEEWFEAHPACAGCQKSRCDACMSDV